MADLYTCSQCGEHLKDAMYMFEMTGHAIYCCLCGNVSCDKCVNKSPHKSTRPQILLNASIVDRTCDSKSRFTSLSKCLGCDKKIPKQESTKEIKALRSRGDQGDAWGLFFLYHRHQASKDPRRTGVKILCNERCRGGCDSWRLLESAAALMHHEACDELSTKYCKYAAVPDEKKRLELRFQAARLGNKFAQCSVGNRSTGTAEYGKPSARRAKKYLKKAVAQGNPDAAYALAEMYEYGAEGTVEINIDKAISLYQYVIERASILYARTFRINPNDSPKALVAEATAKLANIHNKKCTTKGKSSSLRFRVGQRVECRVSEHSKWVDEVVVPSSDIISLTMSKGVDKYNDSLVIATFIVRSGSHPNSIRNIPKKKGPGIDQNGYGGHLMEDTCPGFPGCVETTKIVICAGYHRTHGHPSKFTTTDDLWIGRVGIYSPGTITQLYINPIVSNQSLTSECFPYKILLDDDAMSDVRLISAPVDDDSCIRKLSVANKNQKACYVCDMIPPKGVKLLKCSTCLKRVYCNRKCQKTHWKIEHKHECKKLKALSGYRFNIGERVQCNTFADSVNSTGQAYKYGIIVDRYYKDCICFESILCQHEACPYQIRLDNGQLIMARMDKDVQIKKVEWDGPSQLRFPLGTRVECHFFEPENWKAGKVVRHFFVAPGSQGAGDICRYLVMGDDGGEMWAPSDNDECIRQEILNWDDDID